MGQSKFTVRSPLLVSLYTPGQSSMCFSNTAQTFTLAFKLLPITQESHQPTYPVSEALEPRLIAAGAYPGFCSTKRLGVFLLPSTPPGRDASPSQVTSPQFVRFPQQFAGTHLYSPGWREALRELSVLPKNTTQCPRPGLEPGPLASGTSALIISPLRLQCCQ